jgi:hypothetical protein
MRRSDPELQARAAALAEDIAAGLQQGRPLEWLEELLGTALLEVARAERERCTVVADRRVELWEANGRRMSTGGWPAEAVVEARERRKEALVLANAFRVDTIVPRDG